MPHIAVREIPKPSESLTMAEQVAGLVFKHIRGQLAPEDEDVKSELQTMEGFVTVVALDERDRILATASLDHQRDQEEAFVRGVVAAERGKGLGKKVMHAVENSARERGVKCLTLFSLPGAKGFYEHLDYVPGRDDGRVIKFRKHLDSIE
jgi:GNAT superfamily N-acetyltransferase